MNRTNFYKEETSEIVGTRIHDPIMPSSVACIDISIIAPPLAFDLFAEVNIPTVTNIDVSF